MAENIIDLDEGLSALLEEAKKKTQYRKVRVLNMEVRVSTNPNTYTLLNAMGGDAPSVGKMVSNLIHPDDRNDFHRALSNTEGVDETVILHLIEKLSEAATDRPTKSSSGSSRGSNSSRARSQKSAGD